MLGFLHTDYNTHVRRFFANVRDTINVGWDGRIFDCDFNQQLELGMGTAGTNAGASERLRAVHVCRRLQHMYRPWLCASSWCMHTRYVTMRDVYTLVVCFDKMVGMCRSWLDTLLV